MFTNTGKRSAHIGGGLGCSNPGKTFENMLMNGSLLVRRNKGIKKINMS
jgi:hypothetical protein